jgi:GDP-L-fucose synthase
VRRLERSDAAEILTVDRGDLDLTDRAAVETFFARARPDVVFLAAARVGGILANKLYPADFIRDNLLIALHVIDASWRFGVEKLVFLGSSCIYPRLAPQPIPESALLTGQLEPTNEAYALAKIAGIGLVQSYRRQHGFCGISLMPTNLYGPGDNFDPQNSHVLPALIRRFHEAKVAGVSGVTLWGSGTPRREFLHSDDLADAAVFLMERYDQEEPINVGTGVDLSIREVAGLVADVVGYNGTIEFDPSKPDGSPRKLLDVSKMDALGWAARIELREGLESTYRWFVDAVARGELRS